MQFYRGFVLFRAYRATPILFSNRKSNVFAQSLCEGVTLMGYADGVISAATAPLFMAIGFVMWEKHWTSSALLLNIFKCTFASTIFLVVSILDRSFFSVSNALFSFEKVGYLILSSLLGIIVGDNMWLQALKLLGTRRTMLVDSIKPFVGALLSALILKEEVSLMLFLGMFFTASGVLLVGLERSEEMHTNSGEEGLEGRVPDVSIENVVVNTGAVSSLTVYVGYMCAFFNVLLDVGGTIITKQFGQTYSTFEINYIRFGFAGYSMGLFVGMNRAVSTLILKSQPRSSFVWPMLGRREWVLISVGAFFVTFLCPALFFYSIFEIDLAVAMTLSSLGPIYSIPITCWFKGEQVTVQSIVGSLFAFVGVIPLYFSLGG